MSQTLRKAGIVVHTDAAYDQNKRIAAWGAFLESGMKNQKARGVKPSTARDSSSAELFAAVQGINMALKLPVNCILLYTDSKYVQAALIERQVKPERGEDAAVLSGILSAIDARQITFTVRHVRAHTDNQSKPALRNRWCDAAARTALAEALI
ncbi:MAG: reverse transcriptase-like protein [Desulfovibrio sp.]|uniref:ribonuclease HI n=1 Tax=Desulfovibrio sp. TaxID=885 RepID=UPI00135D208A|nr:RNase H family protein [Desulfovibrio sp.]MTJ93957.1 reverse transcriptase-like protein [Desulfovibrio sp.]